MSSARSLAFTFVTAAGLAAAGGAMEWQAGAGFRFAELRHQASRSAGFTLMPASQTYLAFTNTLGEDRSLTNQIYHNGSGVALGDVDGDGLCDIYLGNIDGPNALYRNLGGMRFTNIAAHAGVDCPELDTTGVLLADIDGDIDLDLIVNATGRGTSIFINDGRGRFTETTSRAGTAAATGSTSAAMADIDGDGDLDLYVANYRTRTLRDEPFTRFRLNVVGGPPRIVSVNGQPITAPELVGRFTVDDKGAIMEHGEPDALFQNDGSGRFRQIAWTNGAFLAEEGRIVAVPYEFGLSVMMRDLNGDGAPDIYVCNDFDAPDRMWVNRGDGTFQLIARLALRQMSLFSMGVDVADIDRDGHDDIFVVDMLSREHVRRSAQLGDRKPHFAKPGVFGDRPQYMRNTLFWNRGDGTYSEVAQFAGIEATEWSWTPVFLDVDLDGYEDLLVSNGHLRDTQNIDYVRRIEAMKKERVMSAVEQLRLRRIFPRLENRALAFRNRGDLRFDEMSAEWGFNTAGVKQGMALADLDNDGDLDVVVNSLNGPALIYRNEAAVPRICVRLKGLTPNTRGIGAKIHVLGGPVPQSQEMISGGRYLSGDDFIRVFATGSVTNELRIEVTWRSGKRSVVNAARANRLYEIDEAAASPARSSQPKVRDPAPMFRDVSSLLQHMHHEQEFNDFERQPLLVRKLSQPGPGVSWFDMDGDGIDDLLIGGGRGGNAAVFRSDGEGAFTRMRAPMLETTLPRDQTAVLGMASGGRRVVITGSSNYEDGTTNHPGAHLYDVSAQKFLDELPPSESATGPLALADINGDGELDLFIGGRVVPARYPEAASSRIFRNDNGKWIADAETSQALAGIGLVTSAVFSDLNDDGASDLVLACEWGPVRIFRNQRGKLVPWNPRLTGLPAHHQISTLDELTGWWRSVAAGDFDNDGRADLVIGNWGENTSHRSFLRERLRIYFGDFNKDGVFDALEAGFDSVLKKAVPLRDPIAVMRALPHLASRFSGYEAFGQASAPEVIGEQARTRELSINTLQSMLLLNRGAHFEVRALPREAQISPVFGIGIADFDNDGNEDVLLAQNFFAIEPMTSRYDAGNGVLLLGDGEGTFRAASGQKSGIAVYGEGRAVAVCDYDGDGRADVCIGQNGAQTKLYRNESERRGLRVRLRGPRQNPNAIGAVMRPVFADGGLGSGREVRAGSGWLSQDSAVQVVGARARLRALQVRWPGGKVTRIEVPTSAQDVEIDVADGIKVLR